MFQGCCCAETEPTEILEDYRGKDVAEDQAVFVEVDAVPAVQTAEKKPPPPEPTKPQDDEQDMTACIVFQKEDGQDVRIKFLRTPIGLTFSNKMPLEVNMVTAHAEELGIKVGWK